MPISPEEKISIENERASDVTLVTARESDIERLVHWDEQAANASTESGFSDEERKARTKYYEKALQNPDFAILLVQLSKEGNASGSAVLDYHHKPADVSTVVGEPFIEEGGGPHVQPMTKEEILAYVQNHDPNMRRAHIVSIALDAHVRGKGVGKKAIEEILKHMIEKRTDVLTFSTGTKNVAMRRLIKGATLLEVRSVHSGYQNTNLIGALKLSATI